VSPKHSSLAFDETIKEFDGAIFEPQLAVIINAHYSKAPMTPATPLQMDVIQVKGSITISF
jgi:hypothetical protein